MPVFPWSMSDFKPGDYNETLSNVLAMGFFAIAMLKRFQDVPVN